METSILFSHDKGCVQLPEGAMLPPVTTMTATEAGNPASIRPREIAAIVAMGRNNEIGFRGDMPWHLPEDLRHFKQITMGKPVIMGRRTWLSIPRRPLPGRTNIVLSRDDSFQTPGAEKFASLAEAVASCPPPEIPFIIGGGRVYAEAMPLLTRLFVTRIEADFPDADTYFPTIDPKRWTLVNQSESMTSASGLTYRFEEYESRPY